MKRGEVVVCVVTGDYGKPRPAVVVQSDLFNPTHASVTICPITSEFREAPLFRLPLDPSGANGLERRSQIMIDKLQSVRRDRVRGTIGTLSPSQLGRVDAALRLWLGLDP